MDPTIFSLMCFPGLRSFSGVVKNFKHNHMSVMVRYFNEDPLYKKEDYSPTQLVFRLVIGVFFSFKLMATKYIKVDSSNNVQIRSPVLPGLHKRRKRGVSTTKYYQLGLEHYCLHTNVVYMSNFNQLDTCPNNVMNLSLDQLIVQIIALTSKKRRTPFFIE